MTKTILFQGNSITDASRDRETLEPNQPRALGSGYANLISARLLHDQAANDLNIYNRGISGNRVVDLYARWKVDALNLKPDLISILIGVNDVWHEFNNQNGVELDRFETVYRMLLEFTQKTLPDTRLVLCEPFLLPCGVVTDDWFSDMTERRAVVRRLTDEFEATFVPFQEAFAKALDRAPADHWAADGVHPTPAGHQLMADLWLEKVSL